MENNLYYTPTIEELSINQEVYLLDTGNYKAEYTEGDVYPMLSVITQLTDYPTIWVRNSYNGKGFKTYEVYPDQIGLKFLDQSDIESLGWEHLGSQWYSLKEVPGKLGYWNYVRLRKWKDHNMFIEGYRADPVVFEETEQQRLFDGGIKNKSELIKLMQQLNIK